MLPTRKITEADSEPNGLVAWLQGRERNGAPLQCVIIERSPANARIDAPDIVVPNEFTLLLTADGSIHRHCKVVSRRGSILEVEFLASS